MKKAVFLFCAVVVMVLIQIKSVFATDEFNIKYNALYEVNEKGITRVTQDIKITNKTAEYYVSEYSLGLSSDKIRDITARDKTGSAKVNVKKEASSTAIKAFFNEHVIGSGNFQQLKLSYIDDSITEKNGHVWTVSLPRINGTYIDEYNTTISLPKSFGAPSVVYPQPVKSEETGTNQLYYFNTEQVEKSGVTMSFGDEQYFDLGLMYHLQNPQNTPVSTEIALPPDTEYQKVTIQTLNPKPDSVRLDPDGNTMAKYSLKAKQKLDITYTGKARLSLKQQSISPKLTTADRQLYTSSRRYWETEDSKIASLASSLKTPENIYKYVVNTLSYNTAKLERDDFERIGAKDILIQPDNSVCMEFTDLFIAIMRAAGYPARELNGYAYSHDSSTRPLSLSEDLLHAWPEYYDEYKGWIPVDPTWENTTKGVDYYHTFDLNHIVFVVKGNSSEYPYPAGSYKYADVQTRDVLVSFSDTAPIIKNDMDIKISLLDEYISGMPLTPLVSVKNNGNSAVKTQAVVNIYFNGRKSSKTYDISLPPFGEKKVTLDDIPINFTEKGEYSVEVTADEFKKTGNSNVHPFYTYSLFLMGIGYLIGIPVLAAGAYTVLHKRTKR